MPLPPKVVAFDIIGTTFSLEPMRQRLTDLGLPAGTLELWFATGLRDAFALAAANSFQPFRSVLGSALDQVLAQTGLAADAAQKDGVLDGMTKLPAQPYAADAFQLLADSGTRIMAVSNGARASTKALLEGAGLGHLVERIVSVDDVKLSKPRAEVYLYAAKEAGVAPAELALVATHAWDVHGAKSAGLTAGFVARGRPYPAVMAAPDVTGETLADVARFLAHP